MLAARCVKEPQAPEGTQLMLGILEALRNLESPGPGRADLRHRGAFGKYQRRGQCGVELHFAARAPVRCGSEGGESLLDAAAALLHQRQLHP